ncbi:MraY family glycosyltransferase [Sphingobacterium siyangense]|uniref:MraY family glycosyltransferase n=1 Tax=Sphingobacterium siyangense TaxID=459529 RepID=UPI003DA1F46F
MTYTIVLIVLFILELLYFKIADAFNIIDKPNERSSHTVVTLRGGGVIFYFAICIYFLVWGGRYPWFFLGLSLMSIISFLDDVYTLSNRIRLIIHFISVLLMAFQLEVFEFPWYYLVITFILAVGVINAYNFMDGINGITACYSLAVVSLLVIANQYLNFIEQDLLVYTMLGILVFGFFNFRNRAKCFAGDVGSVSIAFILLFSLGLLIIKTGNPIYILFLVVYGVDAVWTIIQRILRNENIFEAHRSHLYQYLANEAKINKLAISFFYGLIQFIIGIGVILVSERDLIYQLAFSGIIIVGLSVTYLIVRHYIIKKYIS